MGVRSPEAMTAAFLDAFNSRNKTALLALYADDAVYTFEGTSTVTGVKAIGTAFDRSFAALSACPAK